MEVKKCKDCANFIGGGDWNLCCKNPPESQITWVGHLCYADDPACENFKEVEICLEQTKKQMNCLESCVGSVAVLKLLAQP